MAPNNETNTNKNTNNKTDTNVRPIADKNTKIVFPLQKFAKETLKDDMVYAHNSANNPTFPKKKDWSYAIRQQFKIAGNRFTKEFIYCTQIVNGLYKYRPKLYGPPIIRGFTGVEWPRMKQMLRLQYGESAFCSISKVIVILNDRCIGGDTELKEYIESHYVYHLTLDYYHLSVEEFARLISSAQRPCAYMHIACNGKEIGSFIFMLYADVVPKTCGNFLRLCCTNKGGYRGTPIHRIVEDGWVQCGGYGLKETPNFMCENFKVPHDQRGVLCMANDGRNKDCSTQFFILLQPAPWMNDKYVAFGQLIDGAKLLDNLEKQPTYYEAPTADIKIIAAGVLNLECHGISVSKGTNEFIQSHIEDLNELGRMLINLILDKLWLELEFKKVVSTRSELGEDGAEQQSEPSHVRFMRTKKEQQDDIEKSIKTRTDDEHEQDDMSRLSGESQSFQLKTKPKTLLPVAPFYLPLTDVPYPGEISSEYDLKKFLRGDYCLEADTDLGHYEKEIVYEKIEKTQFSSEPNLIEEREDSLSSSAEERRIKNYFSQFTDSVSFAGNVIKHIPKNAAFSNILMDKKFQRSGSFGSHIIHPQSALLSEKSSRSKKQVEIGGMEYFGQTLRHPVRHAQTKIRQVLLEKLVKFTKCDRVPVSASMLSLETAKKHVAVVIPEDDDLSKTKLERRATGFVHSSTVNYDLDDDDDSDDDVDDDNVRGNESSSNINKYNFSEPPKDIRGDRRSVNPPPSIRLSMVDPTLYTGSDSKWQQQAPTLKNFQPFSEDKRKKILITNSKTMFQNDYEAPKERFLQRPVPEKQSSSQELMVNLQHGKNVKHVLSSDYFGTIDQIEKKKKEASSLRGNEYAKRRPTLTVVEYQARNKDQPTPSKSGHHRNKNKMISPFFDNNTAVGQRKRSSRPYYTGLRMPGDTPLYLSEEKLPVNTAILF